MSPVAGVLIGIAIVLQVVGALGVLLFDDAFDRLHAVGPVSVFATFPLAIALIIEDPSVAHIAKVALTALLLWWSSPFLTRAMARAFRLRRTGALVSAEEEREMGETTR